MDKFLDDCFVEFKEWVMEHRGTRIDKTKLDQIFTADVYTGQEAKDLGLIDHFGEMTDVMKRKYGDDIKIVNFSKTTPWERMAASYQQTMFNLQSANMAKSAIELMGRQK